MITKMAVVRTVIFEPSIGYFACPELVEGCTVLDAVGTKIENEGVRSSFLT